MRSTIISTTSDHIASGGTITGDLTISGDLTVSGDSAANISETITGDMTITSSSSVHPILLIENTNADANAGYLQFYKNTTGEADDDVLGSVLFYGNDDGDNKTLFGTIESQSLDVTDGAEAGAIRFKLIQNGTSREMLALKGWKGGTLDQAEVVVNEDSRDTDFRVESNDSANMLFVDGGTNKVGIGTSSPICPLTVDGAYGIYVRHTSNPLVAFDDTNVADASSPITFIDGDGGSLAFGRANRNSGTGLRTSSTNTMTLDTSGNVGIGTSSPDVRLGQKLDIAITDDYGGVSLSTWSTVNGDAPILDFKKSGNATIGTHSAVADSESLGYIIFRGSDGVEFLDAAVIRADIDGAITGGGTNDMPGRLTFSTTADGASSVTERMRIDSSGNVGIGTEPTNAARLQLFGTSALNNTLQLGNYGVQGGHIASEGTLFITIDATDEDSSQTQAIKFGEGGLGSQDSVMMTILQTGIVGIGTSTPAVASGVGLDIEDTTASSATRGGCLRLSSNDGAVMASGHRLGVVEFAGAEDTSSTMTVGAKIEALTDATWSASENGAYLSFYTTDGDASQSEHMRITSAGVVGIGSGAETAGAGLHIRTGDTSYSPSALADELVIEGTGSTGMTILTANDQVGRIYFGDDTATRGGIVYDHSSTNMKFMSESTTNMILDANSRISLSNNDSGGDSGDGTSTSANTTLGYLAGTAISSGGIDNTFFGHKSGTGLQTGDYNTAIGSHSFEIADGAEAANTYVGYYAGYGVTGDTSEGNVGLGYAAGRGGSGAMIGTIAIGKWAMDATSGNAQTGTIAIGYNALTALTTGAGNTAVGYESLDGTTGGGGNTALGYQSLSGDTDGDGGDNTAIGHKTLLAAVSPSKNVAIGDSAMRLMNGTANGIADCVAIGANAFNGDATNTTTGANGTVAIGKDALKILTTGGGNMAVGYQSLSVCTDGKYNTAIGHQALGSAMNVGDSSTAVGYQSLYSADPDTNDHGSNTAVGKQSGYDISTGTGNTLVGANTGNSGSNDLTTGDNNTFIGNEANGSAAGASNQTVIGSTSVGQADNSVTLGNASVTAVYMAMNVGARFTIGTGGAVTMPNQPAFLVHPASSQDDIALDSAVTIVFGTEVFDQGADFASNTFTAPVTGRYQLSASIRLADVDSAAAYYQLLIKTSNREYNQIFDPDFGQDAVHWTLTLSILADMDASDTAYVSLAQSGGTQQTDITTYSYFSGYLAC